MVGDQSRLKTIYFSQNLFRLIMFQCLPWKYFLTEVCYVFPDINNCTVPIAISIFNLCGMENPPIWSCETGKLFSCASVVTMITNISVISTFRSSKVWGEEVFIEIAYNNIICILISFCLNLRNTVRPYRTSRGILKNLPNTCINIQWFSFVCFSFH